MVLFLFLAHLGVGIAFTLVLVSREAGVKFFRFNAGLAAILIAIALAFRYQNPLDGSLIALVTAEAALVLYWATVGRMLAGIRPALIWTSIAAGAVAIVLQALDVSQGTSVPMRVLTVGSFLSSAAFLGGTCTAMILGHWYLVIPSLEIRHLQSIVKVHIASMVVRVAVVGAAVFAGLALWETGAGGMGSFRGYITSLDGVFFWQRVLFGLVGPALLSYLTWETAKIRSTQSATGILYVAGLLVFIGELVGLYLLAETGLPF
jgi:hypothetical protein